MPATTSTTAPHRRIVIGARRRPPRNNFRNDIVNKTCQFMSMKSVGYVQWQDGEMWLGYLEEFLDYMAQGESVAKLEENLRDIYDELTGGKIPCVRRRAELQVA